MISRFCQSRIVTALLAILVPRDRSDRSWSRDCRVPNGILRDCILTGNGTQRLRLVQRIPLPNVKGRLDHMDVDVKGKRRFVAGLENGTVSELVDSIAMQP
jgi:hypothetical protein